MNAHLLELKRRYVGALGRAALQYLECGLDLFHRHLRSESDSGQAAFGNLAVGLELTLKCYLAEKNLGAVFREIPPEVRALLSAPERAPEFFRWRGTPVDLSAPSFRTIGMDACIAAYAVFLPHMKQPLLPHLEFVARGRDIALHAVPGTLGTYELERAGYAVLQVVQSIEQDPAFGHIAYSPREEDRRFLERFSLKRAERVALALEQARFALSEPAPDRRAETSGWDALAGECPVCHTPGALRGYTELSVGRDEDGPAPGLDFFAVSFSCFRCGLTLHDSEELKLAGMGTLYDRSGDMDAWFAEHGSFPEWEME